MKRFSPVKPNIVGSFRHLLNESALSEMDKIKISLPARQQRAKTPKAAKSKLTLVEQETEAILAEKQPNEQENWSISLYEANKIE